MKKVLIFILACLMLTGCEKSEFDKVTNKLNTLESYKADVTLKIDGTFNGEKINFKREKFITIDNINSSAKVKAIVNNNAYNSREIYYIKSNKEEVTTYKKSNGYYMYTKEPKDMNSIYYITAFINESSNYQFIDSERGKSHFVVDINKDRVKAFLSSYYDVDILNELEYEVISNAKIHLYVDNKNNNIYSLSADFTDVIKFENIDSYNLDTFYLEINYSSFNCKDKVQIPDEYTLNAVSKEKLDAYLYGIEYIKKINSLNLPLDVKTYTDIDLSYDGVKPDSVNFTVLKGKIISGYIKINGFIIKVSSGVICNVKDIYESDTEM